VFDSDRLAIVMGRDQRVLAQKVGERHVVHPAEVEAGGHRLGGLRERAPACRNNSRVETPSQTLPSRDQRVTQ
jgi:hypothetical protein